MSKCPFCGKRYHDEKGRLTMCFECYGENARYGDDTFTKFTRALHSLINHDWIREDEQLFARSEVARLLSDIIITESKK